MNVSMNNSPGFGSYLRTTGEATEYIAKKFSPRGMKNYKKVINMIEGSPAHIDAIIDTKGLFGKKLLIEFFRGNADATNNLKNPLFKAKRAGKNPFGFFFVRKIKTALDAFGINPPNPH